MAPDDLLYIAPVTAFLFYYFGYQKLYFGYPKYFDTYFGYLK